MTVREMRIARVTVNDQGEWILTISGTDICERLWHDDELSYGVFPGNSMGHRMIGLGWMPDRRAMYGTTRSPVERLALAAMAGWQESGPGSWTIPCYPRSEITG